MGNTTKIVALPSVEKSEQRQRLERRLAELFGYLDEVNRLGEQIGRSCLAMDIMSGLTAVVAYADTQAMREITGISAAYSTDTTQKKSPTPKLTKAKS